jgi:hypothetical protein
MAQQVIVRRMTDRNFGTVNVTSSMGNSRFGDNLCIYSSTVTRGYNVTATGPGPGGSFQLQSAAGYTLDFRLQWSNTQGQTSGTPMVAGVPLTGRSHAVGVNSSCTADNSTLNVFIDATTWQNATAATYGGLTAARGVISLTVAPE